MEQVGVKEFKNKATQYLRAGKPIAVKRHDKLIGFYIPVKQRDEEAIEKARERADQAIKRVLEESGLTEDELVELMTRDQ